MLDFGKRNPKAKEVAKRKVPSKGIGSDRWNAGITKNSNNPKFNPNWRSPAYRTPPIRTRQ